MAGENFITVNINVDGVKRQIKMEKEVSVENNKGEWLGITNDNKQAVIKYNRGDYYDMALTIPNFNMSKNEYRLLKSIADNVDEGLKVGDKVEFTLSKADIEKAQELFRASQFTNDIKKEFKNDKKLKIEKGSQDMDTGYYVSPAITSTKERICVRMQDDFYNNFRMTTDAVKNSKDGKVHLEYIGDGGGTDYTYTDKQGKEITLNGCGDCYDSKTVKYTDKENKKIVEFYVFTQDETKLEYTEEKYTTEDGKEVIIRYNGQKNIEYKTVSYEENGKKFEEHYGKDGVYCGKDVTYTDETLQSDDKTVTEYYDKNNKLWERSHCGLREKYDNGVIGKRETWGDGKSTTEYYNKGELSKTIEVEKVDNKEVVTTTYDNGEKVVVTYKGSKIIQVGDFQLEKYLQEQELSKRAQNYRKDFNEMKPKDIAKEIKSQIYGPSRKGDTLDMLNAIPNNKLVAVLTEYASFANFLGDNQDSMFVALSKEWGIDIEKDLMPRLKAAFAMNVNENQTEDILKCAQKIESYSANRNSLVEIEQYIYDREKYAKNDDGNYELIDYRYLLKNDKVTFGEVLSNIFDR